MYICTNGLAGKTQNILNSDVNLFRLYKAVEAYIAVRTTRYRQEPHCSGYISGDQLYILLCLQLWSRLQMGRWKWKVRNLLKVELLWHLLYSLIF